MASKRDELRAFKKLQEAFPNEDVSLECCYDNFRGGKLIVYYSAYHAGENGAMSTLRSHNYKDLHTTPMAAVDWLIVNKPEVQNES